LDEQLILAAERLRDDLIRLRADLRSRYRQKTSQVVARQIKEGALRVRVARANDDAFLATVLASISRLDAPLSLRQEALTCSDGADCTGERRPGSQCGAVGRDPAYPRDLAGGSDIRHLSQRAKELCCESSACTSLACAREVSQLSAWMPTNPILLLVVGHLQGLDEKMSVGRARGFL
jgi:hypothetical protein